MDENGLAENILIDLYRQGFVQTIYNTKSERHQREGWELKSGLWSPWFLNLRPLGDSPELASNISWAMNDMIRERVPGLTRMVGIEMAGVPLVSMTGTAGENLNHYIPYAYTRPLPKGAKPRTPELAKAFLSNIALDEEYGQKELVEGTLRSGDVLCITDDMVTNFGSKLIARYIIEHELRRRGIERESVQINDVAVVLDREQGGDQEAEKYSMRLHSLIKFKTRGLEYLEEPMHPEEFALIADYQQNPDRYQDNEGLQREALERANSLRGK